METSKVEDKDEKGGHLPNIQQEEDSNVLGFDPNSIFVPDTREDLEELKIGEPDSPPFRKACMRASAPLVSQAAAPMSIPKCIEQFGTSQGSFKPNEHLRRVLSGHTIESIKDLLKCFNLKSCKENKNFIIAEIKGQPGRMIIRKDKFSTSEDTQTLHFIDETVPEDLTNHGKTEDKQSWPDLPVSMDWVKIKEDHKEENRTNRENLIVKKMARMLEQKNGGVVNEAMVHKWLIDKQYLTGRPRSLFETYKIIINEVGGIQPDERPLQDQNQMMQAQKPKPQFRSCGTGLPGASFNFDGLEDIGEDMVFDELDDDSEEKSEEDNEVQDIVSKFHSENKFEGSSDISGKFIERVSSEQPTGEKLDIADNVPSMIGGKQAIEEVSELSILREQLKLANQEIERYQKLVQQIQRAVSWNSCDMSQAKVHLSFLFASPLLRKAKNGYEQVMLLDYMSEIRDIESNLQNVNYEIKYNKSVATLKNFNSIISERPVVLHFSGHGIINSIQNMGSEYSFVKNKGNVILLEDEYGMSKYLFEEELRNMVEIIDFKFEVVFIASCHSEFAGKIFSNAGANHVVCIKGSEKVRDLAALEFAQVFYEMLFAKQYSPCESFRIAKEAIKRNYYESESSKFILMTSNNGSKKKHECRTLINFTPGKVKNLDKEPEFSIIPSRVSTLKGRQREIYDIMLGLKESKMLCVHARQGMGKSAVIRNTCQHIKHRNYFKDGIIFLNCKEMKTTDSLIEEIEKYIDGSDDISSSVSGSLEDSQMTSTNNLSTLLHRVLSKKKLLVVLDTIDNIYNNDQESLYNLLDTLIDSCEEARILTTCRIPLDDFKNIDAASYKLHPLSDRDTYSLLVQFSKRHIPTQEVSELVKAHPGCENLLAHPIFKHLGGHPETILNFAEDLASGSSILDAYNYRFVGNQK
ncbi:unnamed protein product [Moneuplotes crassus]|uniref:CHAT domain-containing protein n=1 Tax=Euplotes crassus TaxID=5936 RepID=A0AAD1Y2R0_EUPCR|nr:unnamed protein product [Moneuplotes crassus]